MPAAWRAMGFGRLAALFAAAVFAAVFAVACSSQPEPATPTPPPATTPPTATLAPTAQPTPTPKPTATPAPTATLAPTATPALKPTATPAPTATPTPEPTATPAPIADFSNRVNCQSDGYCGLLNPGGRITTAAWLDTNRMYLADWEGRIRLLDTETGAVQTVVEGLSIPQGLTTLDGRLYVSDMGDVCAVIQEIEPDNESCRPQGAIATRIIEDGNGAQILSYRIGASGELDDRQVVIDGIISWERDHSANGLTNDGEYVYASIGHPELSGDPETGGWITELVNQAGSEVGQMELMGSII